MALAVGGGTMYSAAEIEDNQMRDARLEQIGSTIISFIEDELGDGGSDYKSTAVHKTRPTSSMLYRYQVWTPKGTLVLRSYEAPADRSFMALTSFGFGMTKLNGEAYRTFALPSRDGQFVVQIAECIDEQIRQLAVVTAYCVAFLILPFGLIFFVTWQMLRASMGSVRSIASQLTDRNPLDVTKLQVDRPPEELLPVLRSLDELIGRIGGALSIERRFTSVAAHEMRTPLAGLRAHAQLAVTAQDAEESRDALKAVIQGVDRASHLLNQLLDIARIEGVHQNRSPLFIEMDIAAVCSDALHESVLAALKKGISIETDFRVRRLQGAQLPMFLILRNLVANAVLYSPNGGKVRVSTLSEGDRPVLLVDDSGPGIDRANRELAFERFNRLGQRETEGVGLGLSIVLMAVQAHGAKISLLDSPLGGLRCQIVFAPEREDAHVSLAPELANA